MRKFKTVFMRGGTSKGCMFLKEDLPENREEWDSIFLQAMGSPDPKQIDGLGGTVSSNNKIVIVWKSEEPGIDAGFIRGDYEAEISKILVEKDQAYLVTKEPVELCELPHMERISYRSNNRTVALLENWWKEWFDQKSSTGSTVGYLDLALQLVDREEGYTICFLPKDYQNEKNLCLTPLYLRDGTPVLRNTWFIYPEKAQKNNALNTFIAYARENIAVEQ